VAEENRKLWMKVLAIDMLMLSVAFSISIVGQMFETLMENYSLTLSKAGMLLSAQSIGGLAVAIMSITIIDSLNKKKVIIISGILMSVFLISIGVVVPLPILYFIFIMLGLSTGVVNIISNAVMTETVLKNKERYINFMHTVFSLGAVSAPILSNWIFSHFGLSGVFFIMGGFMLLWAIYSLFMFKKEVGQKLIKEEISAKRRFREMISVIKTPGMAEISIITFLASCWQLPAIYYISLLFSGITGNVSDGAYALSFLFLGMLVSRFLYSKVADRFSPGRVLAIGSFFGAAAWISAMFIDVILLKTILISVAAFFAGNNFPIIFATACRLAPKNTATALGISFLWYYLALFAFLPTLGAIGDAIGLGNALKLTTIPLILLIPAALFLHKKMKPLLKKRS